MRKGTLVALAIAVVSAVVIGALIGSAGIGTETLSGVDNNSTDGPRNFVVNVTDSVEVGDKG